MVRMQQILTQTYAGHSFLERFKDTGDRPNSGQPVTAVTMETKDKDGVQIQNDHQMCGH
jgi:hypothetical protein